LKTLNNSYFLTFDVTLQKMAKSKPAVFKLISNHNFPNLKIHYHFRKTN